MNIYNRLLQSEKYRQLVKTLEKEEEDRAYCRHGLSHFLDVARIAYIENLERGLGISKDYIYSTALLHDIGRLNAYKDYEIHEEASTVLAEELLLECGCDDSDIREITAAVFNHGNRYVENDNSLSGLIYRADEASRYCAFCDSFEDCKWSEERKNAEKSI